MEKMREVLFSGYAKLPTGITASEMYRVIGIIVLIDMEEEVILKADCTLATELARTTVSDLLVGKSIKDGVGEIAAHVDEAYQGSAKKAIITAMRIIYDKFRSYREGITPSVYE
jgi:hypothetical protein